MAKFNFRLIWHCRVRPFWMGQEYVEFEAVDETDAEIMALSVTPHGPFLHRHCMNCRQLDHYCCYVAKHERVYDDGAFSLHLQLPEDWFR